MKLAWFYIFFLTHLTNDKIIGNPNETVPFKIKSTKNRTVFIYKCCKAYKNMQHTCIKIKPEICEGHARWPCRTGQKNATGWVRLAIRSCWYSRVRNKHSPTLINFLTFFQGLRLYSGLHRAYFCSISIRYKWSYTYSFCQIFQGLCLFKGLRLFQTLEYTLTQKDFNFSQIFEFLATSSYQNF